MTLTTEQHTARRGFIGGTDAPRILGLSRYGGPLQVYEEKMGLSVRGPAGQAAHWGQLLEDAIAREYARQTGYRIWKPKHARLHPTYPFIGGYIDRRIVGEPGLLEVKTGSAYTADAWGPAMTDEVPDDYYVQVQHYMALGGFQWADIAALIGGQEYRPFRVLRNDRFIDGLIDTEVTFWREHIEKAVPPPVGGSEWDTDYLRTRYPAADNATVIPATPEDEGLIRELLRARADVKTAEERQRLAENRVKERIADAGGLAGSAGVVTWREQFRSNVDWKVVAHEWRNLLGLYVDQSQWERLKADADRIVEQQTNKQRIRVLRVRGEDDRDA